jgi:hypothetical protein
MAAPNANSGREVPFILTTSAIGAMAGTAVRCRGDGIRECAARGEGAKEGTDVAGIIVCEDCVGTVGVAVGSGTATTGIGVVDDSGPNVAQESLSNPSQPPSVDMETRGTVFVTVESDTLRNDTDFKHVNRDALTVVDPSGLRLAYS